MNGARRQPIVLVVDDNTDMRTLIRSILEPAGQVVHECADGPGALEAYSQLHPECVLMDIELPGMAGIAVTRALRRMDADARVIIVTGHDDEPYRRAAADAGAAAFVRKEDLLVLPALLAGLRSSSRPPQR